MGDHGHHGQKMQCKQQDQEGQEAEATFKQEQHEHHSHSATTDSTSSPRWRRSPRMFSDTQRRPWAHTPWEAAHGRVVGKADPRERDSRGSRRDEEEEPGEQKKRRLWSDQSELLARRLPAIGVLCPRPTMVVTPPCGDEPRRVYEPRYAAYEPSSRFSALAGRPQHHPTTTIHSDHPKPAPSSSSTSVRSASPVESSSDGDQSPQQQQETQTTSKKRQRYLRDVDRRCIISRIDKGEKQATLAREFGVTRAAICHIKKNRDEIVTRYDLLLKSAKEMEKAGISGTKRTAEEEEEARQVHVLERPAVWLLLTTLRDISTSPKLFRVTANRLMMLALEEALAMATVPCQVRTSRGQMLDGLRSDPTLCGIAVGTKGLPLARLYHQIKPNAGLGCIHLRSVQRSSTREQEPLSSAAAGSVVAVDRMDLPRELSPASSIVLFSTVSATGESICAALHALVEIGIHENRIRVVVLSCTSHAVDQICSQFEDVRILTCAVEHSRNEDTFSSTTLGDFMQRYSSVNSATTVGTTTATTTHVEIRERERENQRGRATQWPYGVPGSK